MSRSRAHRTTTVYVAGAVLLAIVLAAATETAAGKGASTKREVLGKAVALTAAAAATKAGPTDGVYSARAFGAVGDGKTNDTAAIQKAIDAAHDAGGGTVHLPKGKYLSGTLYLKSRVTLDLDHNATLLGSTKLDDFPLNETAFRSYTDRYVNRALIWGEGLTDVAVTGRGTIDGQGAAYKGKPWLERPYNIRLVSCKNVLIEGVTMRDSPMWMQHYLDCDFVTVRGITVVNHVNANNDMIDIDCCRDVIIADCFGDTDDDALTLKSTAGRPTENVTVSNCLLSSHCNAIKCGTESHGGFKNITITNCAIRPSRATTMTYGRKSGLAGIALEIVDGGTLDRVTISNIVMSGRTAPIFMRLGNRARLFKEGAPKPGIGHFRNVVVSNVVATGAGVIGCAIAGLPDHPIENVTLSNLKLSFVGGGTRDHAKADVPELPTKYPESTMFGTLPAYGFFCRHVKGLSFRDVVLRLEGADARPAIVCDDVQQLDVHNLRADLAKTGAPMIALKDVRGAMVQGCSAAPAEAFLRLSGKTDSITVVGNDLMRASKAFLFDAGVDESAVFASGNRTR